MYPVLFAGQRREEFVGKVALAVMAKAPRVGKVKTRLAPALGFDGSAAINICFLKDTAQNISEVVHGEEAVGMVCYTPVGDEEMFDGILPSDFALISQRGDEFGERLLAAAEDILSLGFAGVCLIDSDSPTIPQMALKSAVRELLGDGDSVVLGGSNDGGYYLIGLKLAHKAPFERITWSTELVFDETLERCAAAGLDVVELPIWYDVDDGETLKVLERELLEGVRPEFASVDGFDAKATREFLHARKSNVGPQSDSRGVQEVTA